MTHKIPKDIRERQLRELAVTDGYEFVGWAEEYIGTRTRIIVRCIEHGDWISSVNAFVDASKRCLPCSGRQYVQQGVRELQLRELAKADGYTFVGWDGKYQNAHSKAIMMCADHGQWPVTISHFVSNRSRCPACGNIAIGDRQRVPISIREEQLTRLAQVDGYSFVGWDGVYSGSKSRAIMKCLVHGEWSTTVTTFIHGGNRCASCAACGYQSSIAGTLYALISDCGSMVKIGITNKPSQRHAQLVNSTPFGFSTYRQLYCEDGSQPPILERMFHDQFPSTGLRGFDGATEWRKMHPDIITWLDLLGAQ